MVLEDGIDYAWSNFLKEKSELKDVIFALLKDLKSTQDIDVKYIHCNNDGEHESFERLCKQERLGIKFEYTMPGMPQQN